MSTDAAANALPDESTLPDDPETLKGMIRELLAMPHNREQELDGVRQRLDQLLRRLYGPKGEQFRPDQPLLFDGAAEPASTSPIAAASAEPVVRVRSGHGRRKLPENLPRERIVHDVADVEKTCCQRAPITGWVWVGRPLTVTAGQPAGGPTTLTAGVSPASRDLAPLLRLNPMSRRLAFGMGCRLISPAPAPVAGKAGSSPCPSNPSPHLSPKPSRMKVPQPSISPAAIR